MQHGDSNILKRPAAGNHSLVWLLVCSFCLIALSGSVSGQESDPDLLVVAETYWGFDGRVALHEFTPLSIQVKNLGPTPWQGMLELKRVVRGNRQFGATIAEEVSLQGDESRWIQLTPYVIDDLEDWELRWGEGKNHQVILPPVIKGARATVLVYARDDVAHGNSIFKSMPEERFPTSVTSTHGLRAVVLDQVPFWQGARARAFHDWLLTGGRVYLLHNHEGKIPVFPNALSFLNGEQAEFQVGSGTVIKIPKKTGDFTLDDARKQIFNDDVNQADQAARNQEKQQAKNGQYSSYEMNLQVWSKHYDLQKKLIEFSKFKRHWWLIYISVFGYFLVQYPGCFVVGTQQKKVLRFYLLFLAASLFFALLFGLLGQVGGQSKNRVRTVQLARSLGEGDFEVTGWTVFSNIFSGEKSAAYPGSGQVYSTTQEAEYVNGVLNPGTGGNVSFQMLPDSKRTIYHRARLRTQYALPQLSDYKVDDLSGQFLTINISNCYTEEPLYALAVVQGYVYELEVDGDFLKLKKTQSPQKLETYLRRSYDFGFTMWGGPAGPNNDDEEKKEELVGLKRYIQLVRPLVGNSFDLVETIESRNLKMNNGTIRLFVLTATPTEFKIESSDFPDREGTVLFTYDLKF